MAAPAPPTVAWTESEESVPPYSLAPPEEVTQTDIKAWERPWSVQEMRMEANYWSLAGDAGLLYHLQEFSQRLISQTHEIGQEMDGLVHEVKLTGVRMNNVINNFIMLANTQFVENRVYDEDVSQASKEDKKVENQEKTREQREAELIPRVISALKLGIDVIDQAFERIEIPVVADSDSEDEEGSSNKADPVLEEKDPYLNRSLPFLIGSPQFMEDENVGLVEAMSEDEEQSDHGNASVSEDDGETEESDTEYSASGDSGDEDTQRKRRMQAESSTDDDDESDEEMFSTKKTRNISDSDAESGGISASDDEVNEEKQTKHPTGGPTDLTSELAARLGLAAPKRKSQGGMFDEDEGEEDERGEESVKQKSKENLPTNKDKHQKDTRQKKKDKENAEGKAEKGKTKRKHSKLEDKGDDLFGGNQGQDDDDFFGKSKGGLFSKSKGIFDDDEDVDEGNLFDDEEKPTEKSPSKKATEKDNSMFDDEKDDDDAVEDKKETVKKTEDTRPRSRSGKVLPKNAVPVFGGGEDLKKSGFFEDHEEDDDFFGGASDKKKAVKKEKPQVTKTTRAASIKKSDLFDDGGSDEEDLFGSLAATKRPHKNSIGLTVEGYEEAKVGEENKLEEEKLRKKLAPEKKLPPGAVSMFGSGPNPIVAALKKQQEIASTEQEDGDSFSDDNTNRRSSFLSTTSPATPAALKTAEKLKTADSISSRDRIGFAEDKEEEDDDFFFASKPVSDSKPSDKTSKTPSGSHVGGPIPQVDNKKIESSKPAKSSLFDNADNDDDDDFFSVTTKPVERAKPATVPVVSGDDEVKDKKETTNTSKTIFQVANKKTAAVASLFDDEEEEESAEPLFSNKSPQLLTKPNGDNSKARSLFEEDDDLFRSEQDEIPSVDLFSNQGPLSKPSEKKDIHATDTPKRDTPRKDTPNPSSSAPASKKVAAASKPAATSKPAASNLFGGGGGSDDDEDDLFSSGHLAKPHPTASAEPKVLTDSIEAHSAMEAKEEDVKHEVKKPKKPIGAVSMFGGLDPSALLKGRRTTSTSDEDKDKDLKEEKEEKKGDEEAKTKEEKPSEAAPVSKVKLDLFVNDSDDLFSPEAEAKAAVEEVKTDETADTHDKEEAVTPKPELAKPKKYAGAVSMFGGLDPSAFLKKRKVEDSEEDDDEKTDKDKLAPPETAPKPKVSVRDRHDSNTKPRSLLFGASDENDDDDLFAATKKKVPPPTAPKSPMLSPRSPVPTPAEVSRPEGEPQSPEPSRGKKLAGAVSMFGGLDPFAGFKKKSVSVDEEEREPSPPREEHLKSPTINIDGTQSFLGLQRSDSVDFDQPPEADTLSSAIKDRAKLNRRRPQSRKARMLAATSTGISFEDTTPTSPTTPTIPEIPDVQDPPLFDPTTTLKIASNETSNTNKIRDSGVEKSKSKTADLFGNDDLVDGPPISIGKPLAGEGEKDNSVFSKDLFGGKSAGSSSSAGKDLFSDPKKSGVSSAEKSKTSGSKSIVLSKTDKTAKTDKTDEVLNDLFSKPTTKSKTDDVTDVLDKDDKDSPRPDGAGQKGKVVINLDRGDEIFASSSSLKSPAGKGSKSKPAADAIKKSDYTSAPKSSSSGTDIETKSKAPTASLEDDDIFADSGLDKSKDAKKKSGTLTVVAKKNDVGEGKNVDDSKNLRPKKAVTKVDTLLSDTTDIFSDIPDPGPKELKKKVTKKIVEKKAVFKDDVDDIFAETSAAVVKPKRDVKKKVTKSAAVDLDNIFDDPLS